MSEVKTGELGINQDYLVVAGSYERLLYGLNTVTLIPTFIYPSHVSCIKTIDANSMLLATGSSDETIKIYDLKNKKELGILDHHQNTITGLKFIKNYLITSSEDTTICIIRLKDLQLLKTLKGHADGVIQFDVHCSEKLLLSVSSTTLKCWDLTRGLLSYSLPLPSSPRGIKFNKSSDHFCIYYEKKIDIYSLLESKIISTITSSTTINAVNSFYLDQDYIVCGGDDCKLYIYSIDGILVKTRTTKHSLRIKDLDIIDNILVTCSSDGRINTWDLNNLLLEEEASSLGQYDCGCRITCVAITKVGQVKSSVEREHVSDSSDSEPDLTSKAKITITTGEAGNVVKKIFKSKASTTSQTKALDFKAGNRGGNRGAFRGKRGGLLRGRGRGGKVGKKASI